MKYQIIQAGDVKSLAKAVNEQTENHGWFPAGGVCSFEIHDRDNYGNRADYLWFCQALYK